MKHLKYFPTISTQRLKHTCKGVAALKLKSILQGELMMKNSSGRASKIPALNPMNPGVLQNHRIAFVTALSGLDTALTLEIYMTAFPSLVHPTKSRLEITLFICGESSSKAQLKEKLIAAFLNIKPALATLFPEADFQPVTQLKELKSLRAYNNFKYATIVDRKFSEIELEFPFVHKPIGFGSDTGEKTVESPKNNIRHIFQWTPSGSDWSDLMGMMLNQLDANRVIIRLNRSTSITHAVKNLRQTVSVCDRFLGTKSTEGATQKEQAHSIKNKALSRISGLMTAGFNVGVYLLSTNPASEFLATILGCAITGTDSKGTSETFWEGGFRISKTTVKKAVDIRHFPDETEPFTVVEAACAFRLPSPPFEEIPPGIPVKKFRTALSTIGSMPTGETPIFLGDNIHKGIEKPVQIDMESRLRHCFILGQTGTGKSTLMGNMIVQDIQAGRGVGVIDPHGDLVDQILGQIPEHRIEDVIVFDPLDTQRPIGFNVLEWQTLQERDLIIDEIFQIIHQIYDLKQTGGPMFEYYFRGALGLLMGDKKRPHFIPTLLDLLPFFLDRRFRKYLKSTVEDTQLHDFLDQARKVSGDASMDNIAPYINSKLARLQDTTLKRILGQPRSSLNFDDILNNKKIFLVKLGKGRFGKSISSLLANLIVSRLKLATLQRGNIKPHFRKNFFLYIDEAHNLPAENFMELLSEARKYHVGLILATQYAAQLTKTSVDSRDNLLSALTGNVGQTITFRLGLEDANAMAPSFEPFFGKQDIISLPNWHAYVRMNQKNNAASPFSIKTIVNNTHFDRQCAEKIKIMSRLKYGLDQRIVDQNMAEQRSIWKETEEKA